jgi:hypothetical protein
MQIPNEILLPGDILFVASKGYLGKLIKLRQAGFKGLNSETFIPTHVGLIIANSGLLIESTMEDGVEVHGVHKYIDNRNYEDRILIRRNIEFEKNLKQNEKLQAYYSTIFTENWHELYNYRAALKLKGNGKKFCSELAFQCLKQANVISSNTAASKIYPFDLLKVIADDSKWRTVDAAATLSLSRKNINLFFDEMVKLQQKNLSDFKKQIATLENANKEKEKLTSLNEIPNEIKEKLNIMLDFSLLLPIFKKGEVALQQSILDIEKKRQERLLNEKDLRKQFKELVATERNWLLLNSAIKKISESNL